MIINRLIKDALRLNCPICQQRGKAIIETTDGFKIDYCGFDYCKNRIIRDYKLEVKDAE